MSVAPRVLGEALAAVRRVASEHCRGCSAEQFADLEADLMLAVSECLRSMTADVQDPPAYVRKALSFAAQDHTRKRRRSRALEPKTLPNEDLDREHVPKHLPRGSLQDDGLRQVEIRDAARHELAKLTPRQRELIDELILQARTEGEVAARRGTSQQAIHRARDRAIERMRSRP